MVTGSAPLVEALTALAVEQSKAEARTWSAMLAFEDAELARTEALPVLRRTVERAAIALEIGQATGLSEGQVHDRLTTARRVRDRAPMTWLAFRDGRVDAVRVREISSTIEQLQRPGSVLRLDQHVVAYAATHTVAELRRWLKRFVARVEADLALERADTARTQRRVEVVHVEDSMSWLNAYLPTHVAAAIDKRLHREAKALGTNDPRTLAQREADLLAAWLTSHESDTTSLVSDVAVTIEADVLVGLTDGFAASADGSWAVPARWALDAALTGDTFWHRMLIDPVTDDVLAHQYTGRFAPETLTKAIAFRDGTCQAPGCLTPADRCDHDHRQPWPEGPTTGRNLWPLCRRHHNLKGHDVLQWILPSGRTVTAERQPHGPPPAAVSHLEHRLARLLVER